MFLCSLEIWIKKSYISIINNYINLNDKKYYFVYLYNLENLYDTKYNSYSTLAKLNVVIEIFLLIIIYLISDDITKPMYGLIEDMNEEIRNKIKELEESNY